MSIEEEDTKARLRRAFELYLDGETPPPLESHARRCLRTGAPPSCTSSAREIRCACFRFWWEASPAIRGLARAGRSGHRN